MDKTHFTARLREALCLTKVNMKEAGRRAGISYHASLDIINGNVRPTRKNARKLSKVALDAINDRVHDKTDEMIELRRAGLALKEAYREEYEKQNDN